MRKLISFVLAFWLCNMFCFAQIAKKPTIMILPSDNWCNQRYLNGSNITRDMIIHTTEKSDGTSDTEIIENIHENSVGYVKAMELLTNFVRSDGKQVFIFASKLNNNK